MQLFSGRRCVVAVLGSGNRIVRGAQVEDCAILVTAILFLLQPVEWYHYIVGLFDPSHTLPDWGVGAMYKEVAEYTKEGNLWEFWVRI